MDWNIVKCLVVAGPGFTKDAFKQYLEAEAVRRDDRSAVWPAPHHVWYSKMSKSDMAGTCTVDA